MGWCLAHPYTVNFSGGAHMSQSKLFGRRVRAIRKAARITQEEAAESAGLNPKYLGQIERGEKRPSFDATIALAKALNVSPAAFFQLDREETDERVIRKKIDTLLQKCNAQQLMQTYRVVKALNEM
jgi:transcriptional regulator with XRE-family HTH domain